MDGDKKPILATNLDDFLINHEAFTEPHKDWFDRAIARTGDSSLEVWKGKPDYFLGVDIAMKKIMPDASEQERIKRAREWFQQDVIRYIKDNPRVVNLKLAELLKRLKSRFTLVLITTNTKEYIERILDAAQLSGIYDIIFSTEIDEKPDKAKLFLKFIETYRKPTVYVAGRGKENFLECKNLGIPSIYFASEIIDLETRKSANEAITTPLELEVILSNFS